MTALSSPASSKAPKLLVCPVLRATMPSRTSMNWPAATCAIPAVVSMRLAPRQAKNRASNAHNVGNGGDISPRIESWNLFAGLNRHNI